VIPRSAHTFRFARGQQPCLFQEDQAVGFSPMELWQHMGWPVRIIALTLFVESIWSLAVMIDRLPVLFRSPQKQSREFAPKVAGALKDSKLEEAIKIADRNKKSHLAEVVTPACRSSVPRAARPPEETIESSGRALERAEAIVHAKLKRGLAVLATIGSTAPSWVCSAPSSAFCTPSNRSLPRRPRHRRGCGRYFRSPGGPRHSDCWWAIPAVMAFNYFTGRVEAFDVEMDKLLERTGRLLHQASHKR